MNPIVLRRACGAALLLTYLLIVLGAWVRATGSGLSCPDWPTCYGHWLPMPADIPSSAGYSYFQIMLEWVHRLIAGMLLGPLIVVIAWLCWRQGRMMPAMPRHGLVLLLLLVVQATLGGVTVLDQNSPWSVALHLITALLLFSVLWLIFERSRGETPAPGVLIRPLAVSTWLLALGAMASAAMTAKSGASLACSTWPSCNGLWLPDLADPSIRLHMAHRCFAAGTAIGVGALAWNCRGEAALRGLALSAAILILGQIGLGALVINLEVPVWAAVAHQALGVLTFALIARLMWRSGAAADGGALTVDPALAGGRP